MEEYRIIERTRRYREADGRRGASVVECHRCRRRLTNWPAFLHECRAMEEGPEYEWHEAG